MFGRFAKGRIGKGVAGAFALGALAFIAWQFAGSGSTDAADAARGRWFVCTETGKAFRQELTVGMTIPVTWPYTDKPTGVEAELCYWTPGGDAKDDPTPVLLNERAGKSGPTFCPDCGRLVVGRNMPAVAGAKPPPTREQYAANSKNKQPVDEDGATVAAQRTAAPER